MLQLIHASVKKIIVAVSVLLLAFYGTVMHAPVASAESIKLTMMVYPDLGWPDFHEKAIAEFNIENPGIEVEIITGLLEKLQVTLAGGVPVDIFYSSGTQFAIPARSGLLAPLDSLIDRDHDFNIDDYFANAVEAHRMNGVLYGMPQTVSPVVMWYNRSLFEEGGLGYPIDWTWDDLVNEGKKLIRDDSGTGNPNQFATSYGNFFHYNRWPIWIWSNQGRVFSDDGIAILNEPAAVDALEFYVDLGRVHRVAPLPNDPIYRGTNDRNMFYNGQVAMIPDTRFYEPPEEMDWGLVHMPYSKERASSMITNFYGIVNDSKYPEESWKLIRFLLEKSAERTRLAEAAPALPSYIPNARDLIEDAARDLPDQMLWIEAADYAKGPYYPPIAITSIVRKYFDAMVAGTMPARTAAEQITTEINAALSELE